MKKDLHLISAAGGVGAQDTGCAQGPVVLEQSDSVEAMLAKKSQPHAWFPLCEVPPPEFGDVPARIHQWVQLIADQVKASLDHDAYPMVLGGDHACGIGTWSAVSAAMDAPIGLLWIDAHMDSHTPESSPSDAIHGMPVATLLGHGLSSLTQLMHPNTKINPEHLCLLGIRSFEPEEAALLEALNVTVFTMDQIEEEGLESIWAKALAIVQSAPGGYGVSIDLDAFDPADAMGVGSLEFNGLRRDAVLPLLAPLSNDPRLLAAEIAEFNPYHDQDGKTERLVADLIDVLSE